MLEDPLPQLAVDDQESSSQDLVPIDQGRQDPARDGEVEPGLEQDCLRHVVVSGAKRVVIEP